MSESNGEQVPLALSDEIGGKQMGGLIDEDEDASDGGDEVSEDRPGLKMEKFSLVNDASECLLCIN